MSTKSAQVIDMASGGIQDGYLGTNYQFVLLELFAHRSVTSGLDFKLYTELSNVGKFDDVILEVLESGKSKFIFGQAKHKKNSNYMKFEIIMNSKEFRLSYYFDSFLEITKYYKNIESVLLITNNKINDKKREDNGLIKLDFGDRESLYFVEDQTDDIIFRNVGKRFKFPGDEYPAEKQLVFDVLKSNFLAKELINLLMFDTSEKAEFTLKNREFLFENVFKASDLNFRDEILDGTDKSLDIFRSAFEQAYKDARAKIIRITRQNLKDDCWNYWRVQSVEEKLKIVFRDAINDANSSVDQAESDQQLNLFMEKFVFVTNLETKHIEDEIQKELQLKYHLKDVKSYYKVLEKSIKDWITGDDVKPITRAAYEGFFEKSKISIDKEFVLEVTERMFDKQLLEFRSEHSMILDFLDSKVEQQVKLLHIKTHKSETQLVGMRIFTALSNSHKDTFIMLRTSFLAKDFERGVNVFQSKESYEYLIIEVDAGNSLLLMYENQIMKILEDQSKRMIVISDGTLKDFDQSHIVTLPHSLLTDLTEDSLYKILDSTMNFQNFTTKWMNLLDQEMLPKILLRDVLNSSSIAENVEVSKDYHPDLYISRTFVHQNILKAKILNEGGSNEFVFNEQDFKDSCQKNPTKNIHWLQKSGQQLLWKRTSGEIDTILKFIDEEQSSDIREDSIAGNPSRVLILVDVAGMGKSTVLNYLAKDFKRDIPGHWVIKIDLNDYTNEFEKVKPEDLKDLDRAIEFFMDEILGLETGFEKNLFRNSCEATGNVILLFDGFDEVASFYKDQVLQLIHVLLKTKIQKIFIASRPEWSACLEKEFSQLKHSLMPFNKKDQKMFLEKFFKNLIGDVKLDQLTEIIGAILRNMSESLSDNDYKFTGIPLISKLVGEFFEPKVRDFFEESTENFDVFLNKLQTETFNLFTLYQHFVDKNLKIYFVEKSKMDPTNVKNRKRIEREKKDILMNYEKLAVQQILKGDLHVHLPSADGEKLDEEDLEILVEVGLIYVVNDKEKYVHQTYGEWCFNNYLKKHFNDDDCSRFILNVVLVEESYRIIRSFINYWICENLEEKSYIIYREILLASPALEKTSMHVSGQEGNDEIFHFLYSSLTKVTNFTDGKLEIQAYLTKHQPHMVFVPYFKNCLDKFKLLEELKRDFGLEFLKTIFKAKLLQKISESNKNLLTTLKFLRENFSNDSNFLTEIFMLQSEGQSFLHLAFGNLINENLLKLLDELKLFRGVLGRDVINELFLVRADFGFFLTKYSKSGYFDNEFFIQILDKLKSLSDEITIRKIFLVSSNDGYIQSMLHKFCNTKFKEDFNLLKVVEWISRELGQELLKEIFLLKDFSNESIFHNFTVFQSLNSNVLPTLKFLKHNLKFDNDFILDEILLARNKTDDTIVSYFFEVYKANQFNFDLINFLEQDLNLSLDELKKCLIRSKYYLFSIAQKEKSDQIEFLNFFNSKFGESFFNDFYSTQLLHDIVEKWNFPSIRILKYIRFVEGLKDSDFLKSYVSGRNSKKQTIFFYYYDVKISDSIEILKGLMLLFKDQGDFFQNLLLICDDKEDSFFSHILNTCSHWNIFNYSKDLLDFLVTNFEKGFVRKFLLLKNYQLFSFINIIFTRGNSEIKKILDIILTHFGDDNEFFEEMIGFHVQLRKCKEVQSWFKENLNMVLVKENDDHLLKEVPKAPDSKLIEIIKMQGQLINNLYADIESQHQKIKLMEAVIEKWDELEKRRNFNNKTMRIGLGTFLLVLFLVAFYFNPDISRIFSNFYQEIL